MYAKFAIFKLFRWSVGNTLKLKPASFAELGNTLQNMERKIFFNVDVVVLFLEQFKPDNYPTTPARASSD